MRRTGILGACLATAVAVCALIASSAFALPEIGRCLPSTVGKYKNNNCTVKASSTEKGNTEKWEWHKGAASEAESSTGFTSAGGEGVLETVSGTKITCETQSATGKYDQDSGLIKEVEGVIATFKGCSLPLLGVKCNSTGAPEGEIKTFLLKGPLGYISGEKTKTPVVGQELTPEKAKGLFAEFECTSSVKVKVKGKEGAAEGKTGGNCIIAPVENANEMSLTAKQVYKGSGGKQEPQHFQLSTSKFCNLESNTNGGAFEAATQALTTTVTNKEALEIFA
jgi:hypothetical protein